MKRKLGLVLILGLLLGVTACGMDKGAETVPGQGAEQTDTKDEQQKDDIDADEETGEESDDVKEDQTQNTEDVKTEQGDLTLSQGTKDVEIYSSNEDATELVTATVNITDFTAQALLTELAHKGVLPDTVKVNSCKKVKNEGKDVIDLDLTEEFSTYLNTQGTTGELITMGSLCNTFLKAYECEAIHITTEGKALSSGHAEYPGYLGYFESIR